MKYWIRKLTKETVVIFFAGVLSSIGIKFILGIDLQKYIGILFIFLSIFILYTIFTIQARYGEVSRLLEQIGLTTVWLYEPATAKGSYEKAAEIIRSAKSRILIVSHYIPTDEKFEFPDSRANPFFATLEQKIQSYLNNPTSEVFTYTRIIQSADANKVKSDKILHKNMLGSDTQAFEHCKRIFDLLKAKQSRNVTIQFLVCEPILSFPSLLIVDDRYLLFAFTNKTRHFADEEEHIIVSGILMIEDRSGKAVQGFIKIFDDFMGNSYPAYAIQDDSL